MTPIAGGEESLVGRGYQEFNETIRHEGKLAMGPNPWQPDEPSLDPVKGVCIWDNCEGCTNDFLREGITEPTRTSNSLEKAPCFSW